MSRFTVIYLQNEVPTFSSMNFDRDSMPEKARQVSIGMPGAGVEVWDQATSQFKLVNQAGRPMVNLIVLVGEPDKDGWSEGWSVPDLEKFLASQDDDLPAMT